MKEVARLKEVTEQLATMPDLETVKQQAMLIRLHLLWKMQTRNWRDLPFDEVRQFLFFQFGENPGKTGDGIRLTYEHGRWRITFKGKIHISHELHDGRPITRAMLVETTRHNRELEHLFKCVNLTRQT
jgi:hypothetical protein